MFFSAIFTNLKKDHLLKLYYYMFYYLSHVVQAFEKTDTTKWVYMNPG